MTTPRSELPATNLKERIAALEQRKAESVQRATSPTPSTTSNSSQAGSSNGALRDRIARFEKKGGVPIPKGRFGLGVPSSVEGPRKRGELYGNRIPASTRSTSGGTLPISRPGSMASYDQRRSFSASSATSDFDDDHLDYSPMSSPTFTLPPDSPDSITSPSTVPDISPSFGDFSNLKQRGTSFAQALEVARKAETERQDSTPLASRSPPPSEADGHVETPTETAPTIVISSEDVGPVITPEIPTEDATFASSTMPRDSSPLENVQPNKELSYKTPVRTNGTSPAITNATHNPLLAKGVVRVGTPPLNIVKRTLAGPSIVANKASKDPHTNAVPIEPQALVSTITPSPQAVTLPDLPDFSAWISDSHKEGTVDSLPTPQPETMGVVGQVPSENIELKISAPEILPPPDIVVSNDQHEENVQEQVDAVDEPSINSNAGARSRKVGLTLDSTKLDNGSLISPPPQLDHAPHRAATAPPGALEPLSTPFVVNAITSPDAFLSPPGMGLQFESLSSGGSSLSSLGSRPMSMIETSPKLITGMLRMTPATSRGVPMFLPANHRPPRQSDFLYFPPTPENEDTDLGSLTMQKSSHPNRMRSGSNPEDISMPAKQSFSAVVHRKIRETPASATVPDTKLQTPQRVKRATILETPLSPGHGELAALLQEAVMLEDTLNKGELPSENPEFEEETRQKEKRAKEAAAAAQAKTKAEHEERGRLTSATAQLQRKRDEPTSGRLKHTFLAPLTKSRSQSAKEVSTAKAETFFSKSEEPPPVHPTYLNSASLPSQSAVNSSAMASTTLPKTPAAQPTVDSVSGKKSTTQNTKSPISPRFSGLRKFGSISRVAAGDGVSARTSHSISSEMSSEESSLPIAPDEFGYGTGSTLSFPLISPKKASKPIARAASFAEKLWSRTRTKSSGSTLSSTSEINDRSVDSSPVKTPIARTSNNGLPPSLDLPTLPRHHLVVPPLSFEEEGETDEIIPIRRSSSSKRSAIYFSPAPDLTAVPQLPPIVPGIQITPKRSSSSFLPVSNESTRPTSATSVSSIGSLPSPLFGQELVDAFPSVPVTTPTTTINRKFPHREKTSLATPATASFDAALLSSAIHLASTSKAATPKPSFKPLPS
ncbi:hypothetical protein BYT27DRAFT_7245091 [Phlegmacium glaucopus]|nr:hypothetical protein BYT27DRAFT_7245091 [Phlegmacium glaucopus]